MIVLWLATGVIARPDVTPPVLPAASGGGLASRPRRLSPVEERLLDEAIENLLEAEGEFRKARTPRVRRKKLVAAAAAVEAAQTDLGAIDLLPGTPDLAPLLAALNGMIAGAVAFAEQRLALAEALAQARARVERARRDDDDLLLLLMLAS